MVNIGQKYQALYCDLVLLLGETPLGKNIANISDVLLTVHLSIILVINQLNSQILVL